MIYYDNNYDVISIYFTTKRKRNAETRETRYMKIVMASFLMLASS